MAKTIVIDTEVKGVDQAVSDINKIDNAVDDVNKKSISPKFDTEKTEKSLENLQKKGEQIEKVGQGIAGGFALATGVVGSFGSELGYSAEEIESAQAKASSFIGILVSIKPVVEGVGAGFKLLGSILKTNPLILLATIIGGIIVSFLDMGTVVNGIKKGFSILGDAVSATFDFIVDAAMAAIDMYTKFLDVITFGLFDINGAYKSYTKSVKDASAAEKQRQENAEKERVQILKNIAELQKKAKILGEEIKLIEKQKEVVTDRYDREIRMAQASGKDTYEIEQKKLEDLIQFTRREINLKVEKYRIEKALQGENAKFQKSLLGESFYNITHNNQEEIKENNKKIREIRELKKGLTEYEDQSEENKLKKQKENYDKWKEQEEEKTAKAKEEAEKRAEWEKQVNDELQVVESKKSDNYIVGQQNASDVSKQIWASLYADIAKRGNEAATKDLADQKEVNNAKIQMLSDTLGTLSSLTELFGKKNEANAKKAFQINKAISIADAIIKTYQGANAIFATAAANPTSVLFPAQPFISAGLAIAGGLANVAKIASTQFGGGASASGGAGGGDSGFGSGPSLPTVDTSSVAFQFPTAGGNNPQANQQTFVSVTEINNVNNRVQVAEANATFG